MEARPPLAPGSRRRRSSAYDPESPPSARTSQSDRQDSFTKQPGSRRLSGKRESGQVRDYLEGWQWDDEAAQRFMMITLVLALVAMGLLLAPQLLNSRTGPPVPADAEGDHGESMVEHLAAEGEVCGYGGGTNGRTMYCADGLRCAPPPTSADADLDDDSVTVSGTCVPITESAETFRPLKRCICPAVFDPVCGSNGRMYTNRCRAACASVAVAYPGACKGSEAGQVI